MGSRLTRLVAFHDVAGGVFGGSNLLTTDMGLGGESFLNYARGFALRRIPPYVVAWLELLSHRGDLSCFSNVVFTLKRKRAAVVPSFDVTQGGGMGECASWGGLGEGALLAIWGGSVLRVGRHLQRYVPKPDTFAGSILLTG